MDPAGKVAVVSGGASGLGAATAAALIEAGAIVVVLDRVEIAVGDRLHWQQCDVTDPVATSNAVEWVARRFGDIHICINCAGIGGIGSLATAAGPQDLEAFRHIIDVNLIGTFNLSRLVAHRMLTNAPVGLDAERGVILSAASIASFEGQQGMGAYTASKAAIAALTLVWARDLSAYHIRVMSIAAGFFATPMTAVLPEPIVAELLETVEFPKRAGRPEEFARLALFVITNPLLNGETIRLDGGTRPPPRTRWTAP
jgi:NAD(P)-dependent dehydrogenase (short-subunit alcohol dehydrogenase family)